MCVCIYISLVKNMSLSLQKLRQYNDFVKILLVNSIFSFP